MQCPSVSDQNQPAGLMFCRLWTKHTHLLLKEKQQTPSFIIIHITRPHKVWLPDEEGEYVAVGASCLYMCVCAFCSSMAVCARENTALYSQKPGFWLLKNLSFLFCTKTKKEKDAIRITVRRTTRNDNYSKTASVSYIEKCGNEPY